ncbi:peptidoglycan DD-metalloendopeptidase family protein [Diaminobutyricimonas sp. LJ205]|uniref:peptidoglycan DD-metalloendopeptidase family protein n=1 Tax=Diaminobutyricimonas sp. LJ205 TaxID=2683590 RepID=UPI0012F4FD9F|nr:peptidoglycan DD-metalloendopeptidase family protein [Diaminobutyricimonas sp. LJ205]
MLTAVIVGLSSLNPAAAWATEEPVEDPTLREQILDAVTDALTGADPVPPTVPPTVPPAEEPAGPVEEPTAPPAEEPAEPPTQEPTPPADEPAQPPTEEPLAPPAEEPTNPPTEEPVDPPTEQPTNPPTEEPVDPPAEEPVDPPAQEPTNPPAEQPTAPPTQEPAPPQAPGPVISPAPRDRETPPAHRSPFGRTADDAAELEEQRKALEAISAARIRLEEARDAHAQAAAVLATAEAHYRQAEAAAQRLDERAAAAEDLANAIDRLFVSVVRARTVSPDDWALVFGQQDGNLSSLGTAGRLRGLASDALALGDLAAQHRERAIALRAQADAADAELAAVGIEELRAAERSAAQDVDAAERELRRLQAARLAGLNDDTVPLARDSGQLSDVGWALPVTGVLSGGYGWRAVKPLPGASSFHSGLDLAAGCGTPVFAAAAGTVTDAGWAGGYGAMILLDHGSGVQTGYAHLPTNGMVVEKGQEVAAGQLIGVVGTTGVSTGCHLHFEVMIDGGRVNPIPFLTARGVAF